MKGYLIYRNEDYNKNKWFANHIIEIFSNNNIYVELLIYEHIKLVCNNNLSIIYKDKLLNKYDFVINRSRDYLVTYHFELLNYKVFNNSNVVRIANDKFLSHQLCNSVGVNSLDTQIYSLNNEYIYPICIKKRDGYGGNNVYLINNKNELLDYNNYIVQPYNSNIIGDIRTYIINNNIVGSIIRTKNNDFRTNVSLGANVELYNIDNKLEILINKILETNHYDFVGIDFLIDNNNELYFNEIEDVVGCRSLYDKSDIDIVILLVDYIKNNI